MEAFPISQYFWSDTGQNYCISPHFITLLDICNPIPFLQLLTTFILLLKILYLSKIRFILQFNIFSFLSQTTFIHSKTKLNLNQMEKQQHTSLKDALAKQEVEVQFSKMFEDQSNTECFECGKKSKQWSDRSHAIFLCLNCAALYKELKNIIQVKSIGLDLWSKKQLETLALGGNRRFKEFLAHYQINDLPYKQKLKTKAAQYYRILLIQQLNGRQAPQAPSKQEGQKIAKDDIPFVDMSPEQMFQITKEKALWLGSKTKELGSKAFTKIQTKVTSGQLKQDAKKVAKQVKSKAKDLWAFAVSKVNELKKKQQKHDPQL